MLNVRPVLYTGKYLLENRRSIKDIFLLTRTISFSNKKMCTQHETVLTKKHKLQMYINIKIALSKTQTNWRNGREIIGIAKISEKFQDLLKLNFQKKKAGKVLHKESKNEINMRIFMYSNGPEARLAAD